MPRHYDVARRARDGCYRTISTVAVRESEVVLIYVTDEGCANGFGGPRREERL